MNQEKITGKTKKKDKQIKIITHIIFVGGNNMSYNFFIIGGDKRIVYLKNEVNKRTFCSRNRGI